MQVPTLRHTSALNRALGQHITLDHGDGFVGVG
jgi:hypothetical protein